MKFLNFSIVQLFWLQETFLSFIFNIKKGNGQNVDFLLSTNVKMSKHGAQ